MPAKTETETLRNAAAAILRGGDLRPRALPFRAYVRKGQGLHLLLTTTTPSENLLEATQSLQLTLPESILSLLGQKLI